MRLLTSELRATASIKGIVLSGRACPYNTLSLDLGGFVERFAPGAFTESLKTAGSIKLLAHHDAKLPIAAVDGGTLELTETASGVYFRAVPADTSYARDVVAAIQHGTLRQMSFSFDTSDDAWTRDNGKVVRTVKKATMGEISVVSWAAYADATNVQVETVQRHASTTWTPSSDLLKRQQRLKELSVSRN
jgi:HK97 family phage prohead protease